MAKTEARLTISAQDETRAAFESIKKRVSGMSKDFDAAKASIGALNNTASLLRNALGGIGVGLGFSAIVNEIRGFEKEMSQVRAVSGATAQDMERLTQRARELGATTAFSAAEAAQGMTLLAQAGLNADQSLAAIGETLNLAAAGGLSLADAADIATNTLSQFGLSADQAKRVSDVLAQSAASANTTVSQLGAAFRQVGPVAGSLGLSLENTAAALATLSNAGIKGEQAGTGLRAVLSSLVDPSKEAAAIIERLGVNVSDLSDPAKVFDQFAKAGLNAQDAVKIFGREAVATALTLTKASGETDKLADRFRNAQGAAAEMAKVMQDNLNGDLKALSSTISEVMLKTGDTGLTGVLRTATQALTEFIRAATGEGSFAEFRKEFQLISDSAAALSIVLGGRLVSSLTASAQATLANVAATRAHAVALAEEAARTAQATGAKLAFNNMLLAEAQAAVAAATGLQRLTLVQTTLIPAQNRAAAAAAAHTAALQSQAVAAAKASTAATVLRGALAFFGGPIGLAITGVAGAVYLLSTRTSEASDAADAARRANEELNKVLGKSEDLTLSVAEATRVKANEDLVAAQSALVAAEAEQKKFIAQAGGPAAASRMLGSGGISFSAQQREIDELKKQANELYEKLLKADEAVRRFKRTAGEGGSGGSGGVNQALADLIKELDKVGEATKKYHERIATLTKALKNNEITQAEFNRLSALAKEELDRVTKSVDGAGKSSGRLADRIQSTIEQLRVQAATLGMSSVEAELYKLKLEGASAAQLEAARTALEAVEAHKAHEAQLKKSAEAADEAFERSQQLKERGLQIFKDLLPEEEQLKIQEAELVYLFDQGAFGEGQQAVETLNGAIQKLREDVKGTGDTMSQFAIQAARNIQDSFADFLFDPFKEGMDGMLTGFTNMLRRMAAELAAQELLKAIFGGLTKGATAGDGSFGGFMASIAAGVNHDGGIAGGAGRRRNVSPAAFIGAPRFHSGGILGLSPNEVPAILERGEEVLTRNDPRHAANGGGVAVNVSINALDSRSFLERAAEVRQELAIGVAQAMRQYNLGST